MAKAPARTDARIGVLDAIRRGHATVNAIAAELGVTDNAVRLHLMSLERDTLVQRRGAVRSGKPGQPAADYALTPAGEVELSRAYPAALESLMAALAEKLDGRALRGVLVDAGARMAGDASADAGSVAARAEHCAELLRNLGGSVRVEAGRNEAELIGAGCPLAGAVRAAPATCTLIESLLAHRFGLRVAQRCEHGEHPACRFRLSA